MRYWVLSNPIKKKKQLMGFDEDSSGIPLDLGIRIGNGGPLSLQLNLLPLGPAPHDSASSEDLPWPRDQGSLGFRRSIDLNEEESSKKKLRLSKHESAVLEESFKENSNLNPRQKQELAKRLHLRPRQVEVWFQNKRARIKLKQTEMDHEFLRRYRDSLTEENRRLRKELQELRALKLAVASEMCMQTPVATVSVCPSCKRVVTAENSSRANILLPKPTLYSACMHSSVAC